jgi:hypothetical protein
MRRFIMYTSPNVRAITEDCMGGGYLIGPTHGGDEKWIQNFNEKTESKKPLGDIGLR